MNKALIIGGNNGIGLSIGLQFLNRGYKLIIVDKDERPNYLINDKVEYIKTNLLYFNKEIFEPLVADKSINYLIITAGIGRIAYFENLNLGEIKNTISLNTIATIEIIRLFYHRIKNKESFYTAIMVSIAGHLSSPLFSVYSASKSAVARFIESVNIELEAGGYKNKILDVSPGALNGTRFNGGANDVSLTSSLANDIIENCLARNKLFIPHYNDIYKDIIEDYQRDPHTYGISSYNYKLNSQRINNNVRGIGYLSGTFDLFHIGHLNLLKRAKEQCDYLIVGVHANGRWKGKETFIPLNERKEIVAACKYVDEVVDACNEDSDAWLKYGYSKLFVGSDYKGSDRFKKYETYFKNKSVQIIYFPYTLGTSSTQLREVIKNNKTDGVVDSLK